MTPVEQLEVAREIILRRLSLRAHSRSELEQALAAKGVATEVAATLLDRFSELDLVDDQAFAEQWVSSRHRTKGLSRRALSEELRRKGVASEVILEATSAVGRDDEVAAATDLARKKLRTMGSVTDPVVIRRRLAGALARRGYGPEVVYSVVARVLSGAAAESEPDPF